MEENKEDQEENRKNQEIYIYKCICIITYELDWSSEISSFNKTSRNLKEIQTLPTGPPW